MDNWEKVCAMLMEENKSIEDVRNRILENFDFYRVYPHSIAYADHCYFLIVMLEKEKKLIVFGIGKSYKKFNGVEHPLNAGVAKICDLSNENCDVIRKIFKFTNPSTHTGKDITIGLGDRLGLASAGHIRLLKGKNAFPVLAQQSVRELTLTGRTFQDVLAAASWAVFQEGYTGGFGADGDHLKTSEAVKTAMDCGYTMITLDCSDYTDNTVQTLAAHEIDRLYAGIKKSDRQILESKYLEREFPLENHHSIKFSLEEFKKTVLIYLKAINYTIIIYNERIKNCGREIDFEMSIDETLTPTTPESHYFVAAMLMDAGVRITSLAPRFCGEFQKGIDYIGDKAVFAETFEIHAEIARKLGYKISIHSGSDKFGVFPIIGEKTKGRYHLKTAGTNWLEAVRIIAEKNPGLYRKMHAFAIANLDEARKYYHVGADIKRIPDIAKLRDNELPGLMNLDDSRQVLHITYGIILLARNPNGTSMFRDDIYALLHQYEPDYYHALEKHIGKHLELLGV